MKVVELKASPKAVAFATVPSQTVFRFSGAYFAKLYNHNIMDYNAVRLSDFSLDFFQDTTAVTPVVDAYFTVEI